MSDVAAYRVLCMRCFQCREVCGLTTASVTTLPAHRVLQLSLIMFILIFRTMIFTLHIQRTTNIKGLMILAVHHSIDLFQFTNLNHNSFIL